MMRGLVARHQGLLPLDTVESIWRIIISTFTYVQSPYSVHADISGGDARDARLLPLPFRLYRALCPASRARPRDRSRGELDRATSASSASRRQAAAPWWRAARRPARAQNHRPAAFRRAAGPSGRHAALRHRAAARRGRRARRRPLRRTSRRRGSAPPRLPAHRRRHHRQRRTGRSLRCSSRPTARSTVAELREALDARRRDCAGRSPRSAAMRRASRPRDAADDPSRRRNEQLFRSSPS